MESFLFPSYRQCLAFGLLTVNANSKPNLSEIFTKTVWLSPLQNKRSAKPITKSTGYLTSESVPTFPEILFSPTFSYDLYYLP